MTWDKQKRELLRLLEKINAITNPNDSQELLETYLLSWQKARKICMASKNNSNLTSSEKALITRLLIKFKQQVESQFVDFMRSLKKQTMGQKTAYFYSRLLEYIREGDSHLKVLPLKSYEIYEEALSFVELYRFTFNISLYHIARQNVLTHLRKIKTAFEVEAGVKNLEEEQKAISDKLSRSLKSTSPNAPAESISEEEKHISEPEEEITEDVDEKEVLLSELVLPDESPKLLEIPESPKSQQSVIQPPKNIPSGSIQGSIPTSPREIPPYETNAISRPAPLAHPQIQINSAYAYQKWFPTALWDQFALLRYCVSCGSVINPQSRACVRCGRQY